MVVLHLSLDDAVTYENVVGTDMGQEIVFKLLK